MFKGIYDKGFLNIAKNSSFILISKIFSILFGFATNIIVARYYGAETVGIVAMVNSFIAITGLFVIFGTNTSILKLIPEYNIKYSCESAYYVFKKHLAFLFILAIPIIIFLQFFSPLIAQKIFNNSNLAPFFVLASFLIFFIAAKDFNLSSLRALHDIKTFAILNFLPSILTFISIIITTFYFFNKNNPVYIYIFIPALMFFITIYFAFKKHKKNLPVIQNEVIKKIRFAEIITASFPLFLISGMHLIMSQTDIVMLGRYLSERDVGLYAVAMRLALITSFVLNAVNAAVSPKFSEYYHSGNIEALKKSARDSSKLIFITTFPVLLFLLIFGKFILGIFGEEFKEAYLVLIILISGQMVNSLTGSISTLLAMIGENKFLSSTFFFSLILNIILNIILIKKLAIIGAGLATSFSMAFLYITLSLYLLKKHKISTIFFIRRWYAK